MPEALAHSTDVPPDAVPDRAAERLAALKELAEIGMRLARGVVAAAEAGEAAGDVALTYARIARAVRQTLALEARLSGEADAARREIERKERDRRIRIAQAPIDDRSRLVRRAVLAAIEADTNDQDDAEALTETMDERLSDREDDDDFLDRPISELVALVCKDLGVSYDPHLWEDETWAKAEKAAAEAAAQTASLAAAEARAGPPARELTYDATPPPHASGAPPTWLSG